MAKYEKTAIASFLFFTVASLVAWLLRDVAATAETFLYIGGGVILASGVLALCLRYIGVKKRGRHLLTFPVQVVLFAVNALSLGILIRAWYVYRGFSNPLGVMILVSVLTVLYFFLFVGLSKIPLAERHPKRYMAVFTVLSIVLYAVLVFTTKTTFLSTFGYYMIVEIPFLYAAAFRADGKESYLFHLLAASYSVIVVAIILAVVILSDGDFDLDLDFGGLSDGKKKKKKD